MSKNTHLEHLEDELINNGYDGGINAIRFLESLRDMLGTAASGTRITTKWDGAPAIICGTDPETGLFFVGTKSVFNKEPKAAFSDGDVDYYYPGPLNSIMKTCLEHLKKLPISGILQGDLLYTKTPTLAKMGGETGYKFRPNTITYFAQQNSPLGDKVAASKMGIVFHTTYSGGPAVRDMSASFGANVSKMQGNKNVTVFSSDFSDATGSSLFSSNEKARYLAAVNKTEGSLKQASKFLDILLFN